jgi:hypothetical protein
MLARVAADAVVALHLAFIIFVVLGALLVLRWKWVVWAHVPAVIWGAAVEFTGAVCPLTPLEQHLRVIAGDQGYAGGFLEHYVVAVIYPAGLTIPMQQAIGAFVMFINAAIYGLALYLGLRRRRLIGEAGKPPTDLSMRR